MLVPVHTVHSKLGDFSGDTAKTGRAWKGLSPVGTISLVLLSLWAFGISFVCCLFVFYAHFSRRPFFLLLLTLVNSVLSWSWWCCSSGVQIFVPLTRKDCRYLCPICNSSFMAVETFLTSHFDTIILSGIFPYICSVSPKTSFLSIASIKKTHCLLLPSCSFVCVAFQSRSFSGGLHLRFSCLGVRNAVITCIYVLIQLLF